jgi:Ni/Co efflux regulator RcnB
MNKLLALTSVLLLAGATATPVLAQQYDPGYAYGQSGYDDGNSAYDDSGYQSNDYRNDSYRDDNGDGYDDSGRYAVQSDDRYDNGDRDYRGYRDQDRRDGYRSDRNGRRYETSRYDRRHDRRRYAQQRYHASSRYYYPRGYRAGNWNVGSRLPSGYYSRGNYVDYRSYRLSSPPRGYQWVRVDNDVYLVSPGSGLIRDILYGLFY